MLRRVPAWLQGPPSPPPGSPAQAPAPQNVAEILSLPQFSSGSTVPPPPQAIFMPQAAAAEMNRCGAGWGRRAVGGAVSTPLPQTPGQGSYLTSPMHTAACSQHAGRREGSLGLRRLPSARPTGTPVGTRPRERAAPSQPGQRHEGTQEEPSPKPRNVGFGKGDPQGRGGCVQPQAWVPLGRAANATCSQNGVFSRMKGGVPGRDGFME